MVSRRGFLHLAAGAAGVAALDLELGALAQAATAERSAIILSSNENAYGPSPRAAAAMRDALSACNRYVDPDDVMDALAELHRIQPRQVLVGCGSTDILRMAAYAFTGPGRRLVMASPTFEAIRAYGRNCGAEVVEVPLRGDYSHDLEAMLAASDAATGLVYLCNPNNPTASLTPAKEIEAFLGRLPGHTRVLIDEAYHEFALDSPDYASFIERAAADPRIIVARTFSKIHALAGLRLGYGVGTVATLQGLERHGSFDNLNVVALHAGLASLEDRQNLERSIARNNADRAAFMQEAKRRKVPAIPSWANFVMLETGRPVRDVIQHFRQRGIRIGRPFPPLPTHVRVSLGLPDEMRAFWRAWDALPALRSS